MYKIAICRVHNSMDLRMTLDADDQSVAFWDLLLILLSGLLTQMSTVARYSIQTIMSRHNTPVDFSYYTHLAHIIKYQPFLTV